MIPYPVMKTVSSDPRAREQSPKTGPLSYLSIEKGTRRKCRYFDQDRNGPERSEVPRRYINGQGTTLAAPLPHFDSGGAMRVFPPFQLLLLIRGGLLTTLYLQVFPDLSAPNPFRQNE